MTMAYTRLSDPNKVAASPRQLKDCQDKINACLTRLFRQPIAGGNPFLFALCGPKPHQLARRLGSMELGTAATDGKQFYWNPDFLESLSPEEVATVMSHESYHVLFFHCSPERAGGLDAFDWNIAVDYVVNATIETEHEKSGRNQKFPNVWTGPLGTPITLQQYIEWIDGQRDNLPQPGCFADITVFGRSPESIYEQVRKAKMNSPRRCKEHAGGCGAMSIDPKTGLSTIAQPWDPNACQKCGAKPNEGQGPGSLDSHLPPSQTREETLGDMMRAADQVRATARGEVPASIEEALGRLKKPELTARDIIKMAIAQKRADAGNINDWKRFRRRPSYIYTKDANGKYVPQHQLYTPKKHDYLPRWVCLMDTSGSMSDEDITNGVKELQLVADVAEGWIVPCDAKPYWDKATKVTGKTSLARTQVVGRGGTVFEEFFRDLPKQQFGDKIDLVIILTDGDCDQVPTKLMPQGADCLWIITNKRDFKPNFGRVAQLRPSRQ
jgi:predicted metal-dependent peptidase